MLMECTVKTQTKIIAEILKLVRLRKAKNLYSRKNILKLENKKRNPGADLGFSRGGLIL